MKTNGYGFFMLRPETTVAEVASCDNVVMNPQTSSWRHFTPDQIGAANPNCKVWRYHCLGRTNPWDLNEPAGQMPIPASEFERHPEWYLVDVDANRLSEGQGMQFVDQGAPGFTEAYIRYLLPLLEGYTGVVLDDWWPFADKVPASVQFGCYLDRESYCWEAWLPFITTVCNTVRSAGYKIVGNCAGCVEPMDTFTGHEIWELNRALCDAVVYESFSVTWERLPLTPVVVNKRIEAVSRDPKPVWLADTTVVPAGDVDRLSELTWAMSLMVDGPNRTARTPTPDAFFALHRVTRMQVGVPLAPPMQSQPWAGGARWSRRFSSGLALLNYQAEPWTVRADGTYFDCHNQRWTPAAKVELPAYSGRVLSTRPLA